MALYPRRETGSVPTEDGAEVPYMVLGEGRSPLLVVPGVDSGVMTVGDPARRLAWYYRDRSREYRIVLVSRRVPFPGGLGYDEQADDVARVLDFLGWPPGLVEGVFDGGAITQQLAVRRPDLVQGLVLASSLHRADEQVRGVVGEWLTLALDGRWADLSARLVDATFRPELARRLGWLRLLLRFAPAPRSPKRVQRILQAILDLDHRALVRQIAVPTLVIGGMKDRVVPAPLQREMAAMIPRSRVVMYPDHGHGVMHEHRDYEVRLRAFAAQVQRAAA